MGFFICGPQFLIAMAAAENSHKHASGSSTGFVSLFAYIGAAAAGADVYKRQGLRSSRFLSKCGRIPSRFSLLRRSSKRPSLSLNARFGLRS